MEYLKNRKLLIGLIVLFLFVFSISFVLYNKFYKSNNKEKTDDKEIVDKEVEVESGDLVLNNSLIRRVRILERVSIEEGNDKLYSNGDIYSDKFYYALVSSESKLFSVLEQLYYEYQNPVTTNYQFGDKDHLRNQMRQIDVDFVESEYRNVFGSFVDLHKSFDLEYCPLFIYDSNNLKYYGLINNCNNSKGLYLETFVNNITTKKDEAYVYISLAAVDGRNSSESRRIYTDYNMSDLYDGVLIGTDKIINSNNYKLFSQYKYVFKKDKSNNYYFRSIEKIN